MLLKPFLVTKVINLFCLLIVPKHFVVKKCHVHLAFATVRPVAACAHWFLCAAKANQGWTVAGAILF